MPRMRKISWLFIAAFCACLAIAGRVEARTSADIAAQFSSGVAAYDAGDYQKAFQIWWDLRYEDLAAMRNLGMMLRKGLGTSKDPAGAANHPGAQYQLGEFYETGAPPLIPQDVEMARQLYAAAARSGLPEAVAR